MIAPTTISTLQGHRFYTKHLKNQNMEPSSRYLLTTKIGHLLGIKQKMFNFISQIEWKKMNRMKDNDISY